MTPELKARMEEARLRREGEAKLNAAQDNPELAASTTGDTSHAAATAHAEAQNKLLTRAVAISGTTAPKVATVEELDADPLKKLRIFRSRIPGSAFCMSEGYTIYFINGWYETSDESEIRQLDAVANKVPTIHTDEAEVEIVEALLEARRQGFTGSIAEAMAQQLTVEQRISALRVGNRGNAPALNLPSLLPPVGDPHGNANANATTGSAALSADLALRAAIRANTAESNSN